MTFAEGFYNFFRACPLIERGNRLNFNYRGVTPSEFTIDAPPSGPPIKTYMSGSSIKERFITLGSNETYGEDARIQIQNSGYYEALEAWVTKQNDLKNFPETPDGTVPIKIECVTDGYLMAADDNLGWYQIQFKLTYLQGGKR